MLVSALPSSQVVTGRARALGPILRDQDVLTAVAFLVAAILMSSALHPFWWVCLWLKAALLRAVEWTGGSTF